MSLGEMLPVSQEAQLSVIRQTRAVDVIRSTVKRWSALPFPKTPIHLMKFISPNRTQYIAVFDELVQGNMFADTLAAAAPDHEFARGVGAIDADWNLYRSVNPYERDLKKLHAAIGKPWGMFAQHFDRFKVALNVDRLGAGHDEIFQPANVFGLPPYEEAKQELVTDWYSGDAFRKYGHSKSFRYAICGYGTFTPFREAAYWRMPKEIMKLLGERLSSDWRNSLLTKELLDIDGEGSFLVTTYAAVKYGLPIEDGLYVRYVGENLLALQKDLYENNNKRSLMVPGVDARRVMALIPTVVWEKDGDSLRVSSDCLDEEVARKIREIMGDPNPDFQTIDAKNFDTLLGMLVVKLLDPSVGTDWPKKQTILGRTNQMGAPQVPVVALQFPNTYNESLLLRRLTRQADAV